MTLNRYAVPFLAAVLLFPGCDADDAPATDEEAAAVPEAEDLALEPGALTPINQSDVRGSAAFVRDEGSLRLVVEGEGLEPGTRYSVNVREGRCATGGPLRLPMGRMTASPDGTGSMRMQVDDDRLPAESDYFIQIYSPDDSPVACANIEPEG